MSEEFLWNVTHIPGKEEVYLHRLIGQDENDGPNPKEKELAFVRKNRDGSYTALNPKMGEMTNADFRILLQGKDLTEVFKLKYPEVAEHFGMKRQPCIRAFCPCRDDQTFPPLNGIDRNNLSKVLLGRRQTPQNWALVAKLSTSLLFQKKTPYFFLSGEMGDTHKHKPHVLPLSAFFS